MSIARKTNLGRPADLAKREAILVAARDAFFEHGYGAAAIEQIAAAAGVSKVTIYNHFSDKQGLFTAAIERECERMRSHFSIESDGTTSLRDRLLHIGHAMVAFLNAGPRRMKATMAAFLGAMADTGALAMPNPALAAEQFAAMCKGFGDVELRFGVPPSDRSTAQRVEAAVEAFLKIYGGAP